MKFIYFSGEDDLSEALAKRCVEHALPEFEFESIRPRQGGVSGVRRKFSSYSATAAHYPVFVMVDQDTAVCPPSLRQEILAETGMQELPEKMVLSIVAREAEAWVLGDGNTFAEFFGIALPLVPMSPEALRDAKEEIVTLASKSKSFRSEVCPRPGTTSKVGPRYSEIMCQYVLKHWRPHLASKSCPTLCRTLARLEKLKE